MTRFYAALAIVACVIFCAGQTDAQTVVASEDFDGGALNLTSGFDPGTENLDGGGGDWYGVGSLDVWPQAGGIPFGMIDESITNFLTDTEGILSDATSDRLNNFFGIADTREWTDDVNGDPTNPLVTSWTFDISSATGAMQLNIDMGQCSDGNSFTGFNEGFVLFEYSIDGAPFQTAFSCDSFDASASGFAYRLMDEPLNSAGVVFVCQATGPGTIQKISAEDGSVSANTILDKCPPAGASGEGTLDTFVTDIVGSGSSIEIRMTTAISFESFVFDNIVITESSSGPVGISPETITTTRGSYVSGGIPEISASDNQDYRIARASNDIQSRTEFEVTATSPTDRPNSFEVTLEGAVFARSNVVQTIELFDYDLGVWELVDSQNANRSPSPDKVVTIAATGDLSRFVEVGTNQISARVRYRSGNPRQNFTSNTDLFSWTIE